MFIARARLPGVLGRGLFLYLLAGGMVPGVGRGQR